MKNLNKFRAGLKYDTLFLKVVNQPGFYQWNTKIGYGHEDLEEILKLSSI